MSSPEYTQTQDPGLDELVVGGPVKTRTVTLTENQAQGEISRGAILGYDGTNYASVHQTGAHTAATSRAVLAQETADPSGGDIDVLVYDEADLNEEKLSTGGTVTVDQCREALRAVGIHLKKPVSA